MSTFLFIVVVLIWLYTAYDYFRRHLEAGEAPEDLTQVDVDTLIAPYICTFDGEIHL